MNFVCLSDHLRNTWRYRTSFFNFLNQLLWRYAHDLPNWFFPKESVMSFCYPEPLGNLIFNVRNNASDIFIFEGVFTRQSHNLRLLNEPKTILDLGANAGFTTVFFKKRYPMAQVACVEPMPSNLKCLKINLRLNQIDAEIFPAAIAIKDGAIMMDVSKRDYSHKVSGINTSLERSMEQLWVPAVTVPTICNKLGWNSIDFLKVDIEGYEKILFSENCSWIKQVKAMCIEWHGNLAEEHLSNLAKKFGFNEPRHFPGTWLLERPHT
ncbi:MAG: hypothetical protein C5B47_02945 [Verrucomicrobia bacterium]|nr:MAG: hypothetical protein C5B47_02945 [Verrucomicrobiota bacterium]